MEADSGSCDASRLQEMDPRIGLLQLLKSWERVVNIEHDRGLMRRSKATEEQLDIARIRWVDVAQVTRRVLACRE